jgi:CspA family cold shock protein
MTGVVKWFNKTKGYGFIQPDDNSDDVFVHINEIERVGLRTLNENDKISFNKISNPNTNKVSAGEISILS